MPAKKKSTAPAIESTEQLHATVDTIARLEVEIRGLVAARDKEVQEVLDRHDAVIEQKKKLLKSLTGLSNTYSTAHRVSVFGKLKSAASALARFGFRNGNPTLKLLNKKHTWESVLGKLKEKEKTQFIRTKEDVDKEAIQKAALPDSELAELGLRIDQGETFFVESKADEAKRITDSTEAEAA